MPKIIDPDALPDTGESASARLLEELTLYGYRRFSDEPDGRPLPEGRLVAGAAADMADALVATLEDTRIEPDLDELLWGLVNLFHRAVDRIERELDGNEQAQRRLQREQDGSEVRSVELERTLVEGLSLLERRDTMEAFRDATADQYRLYLHKAWMPRSGSRVSRGTLTSAMVDSRDFVRARARAERTALVPTGTLIAFSAGPAFSDHRLIFDTLDKVRAKHPDMVLVHGATTAGGEMIAARWAEDHGVECVAFRPDWKRDGRAAPFKRNDRMLALLPAGLIVCPGTGIQHNIADKARTLGLPLWDLRGPR